MVDGHAQAGMPCPGRLDDHPVRRRIYRGTARNRVVLTNMDLGARPGWIVPPAIWTGDESRGNRVDQLDPAWQYTQRPHILPHELTGELPGCPPGALCRSRVGGVGQRQAFGRAGDVLRVPGNGVDPAQQRELDRLPVGSPLDRKRGRCHGNGGHLAVDQCRCAGYCKCGNDGDSRGSCSGCLRLPTPLGWLGQRKRMIDAMLLHQRASPFPGPTPRPVPSHERRRRFRFGNGDCTSPPHGTERPTFTLTVGR